MVGARVQSKAHHVTALAECHPRYGANAKTTFVNGTVVSVDAAPSSNGKRAATLITAEYELGGGTIKRCQLNSRGVKMAEAETTTGECIESVIALGIENFEPVSETIEVGAPSVAGISTQEMLDARQSSDEEPEEAGGSVETTTAAPVAARYRTTVATVHYVERQRASSTEPPLNGSHTSRIWSGRNVIGEKQHNSRSSELGSNKWHECVRFFPAHLPSKAACLYG